MFFHISYNETKFIIFNLPQNIKFMNNFLNLEVAIINRYESAH